MKILSILPTSMIIILSALTSCGERVKEGMIIFTQVAGTESRIAAIDPVNPDKKPLVLTENFSSALSPDLSYDGRFLLFTARQKDVDSSQVWMMDLRTNRVRQITSGAVGCYDPAWLPGGQVVFVRQAGVDENEGTQLHICNSDGTEMKQITFDPYTYKDITVLSDGRLLVRRSAGPVERSNLLMVIRPDGTKNILFYRAADDKQLASRSRETADGRILFIEESITGRGEIVSISYNRPLHSRRNFTTTGECSFRGVFPYGSDSFIVSYKPAGREHFILGKYDTSSSDIKTIYESDGSDAIDPLVVQKKQRQKKLPSEVDMGVSTSQLLCQDVNFTGIGTHFASFKPARNERIEIVGRESSLGFVVPESDGSLYLKVVADTPFRIRKVDEDGNINSGPSAWIYLRPNERRGCIGCHEDPELVPDNRLPLAVKKLPVSIPTEIKSVSEKEIEPE